MFCIGAIILGALSLIICGLGRMRRIWRTGMRRVGMAAIFLWAASVGLLRSGGRVILGRNWTRRRRAV